MRRALFVALSLLLAAGCSLPSLSGAGPSAADSGPATGSTGKLAEPTAVSVPSIGAVSSLVATTLNPDGTAEVPPVDQPQQASFLDWADDIEPQHPLVVYGHINGCTALGADGRCTGRHVDGVFVKLDQIPVGAEVTVTYDDGTVRVYKITRTQKVSKQADPARNDPGFPTAEVYDPTPGQTIRLVTCGGDFDAAARSYRSNIIAYGDLVPA